MSRKGKDSKRETALTLNRLGSLTRELGRYDEVGRELVYFNNLIIGCGNCFSQPCSDSSCCDDAKAMDYHQKALNIQKSGSGVAKAMTAETCVLMGMVKSKLSEFQSALDVRSKFSIVVYYLSFVIKR